LDLPTEYSLIAVGDVDGDGSNDLLLSHVDALAIAYGRRWSGAVTLEPELIIELEPSSLYAWLAATADDIDGDRSPDIALAVVNYEPESSTAPEVLQNRFYVVRGIGERVVGRIQLDDSYLAPSDAMPVPSSSEDWSISSAGDVDGDGGHDILSATPTSAGHPGAVTLIPSTPRRPD
jgi:hypothetical protein